MVARLWRLVLVLHQARYGRTQAQLRAQLGVSRSTLYRDLAMLEQAQVSLERFSQNGEVRFRLLGLGTLSVAPTPLQVAAVRLAREALGPLNGTALVRELDALIEQWVRMPSTHHRVSQRTVATDRSVLVATIDGAMAAGQRLVLEYQGQGDPVPKRREVDPLALRLEGDQPYLFAYCHERQDYRLFKLARVAVAQATTEPIGDHSSVDLERLLAHSVRIWIGAPLVPIVVRLSPRAARFVAEYPLVPDQATELLPDGSAMVRARVTGTIEAMRWVLSWGADAEVISPSALRSAVRNELAAAARHYSDGPISAPADQTVSQGWDAEGARSRGRG